MQHKAPSINRIASEHRLRILIASAKRWKDSPAPRNVIRDTSMVAMLYLSADVGLRISEVIAIKKTDVNLIDGFVTVLGKGKKIRTVMMSTRTIEALTELMSLRSSTNYLFPSIKRRNFHITRVCAHYWLHALFSDALARVTGWHAFRHRAATSLITKGAILHSIRDQLGHSSIQVTSVYLHLTEASIDKLRLAMG